MGFSLSWHLAIRSLDIHQLLFLEFLKKYLPWLTGDFVWKFTWKEEPKIPCRNHMHNSFLKKIEAHADSFKASVKDKSWNWEWVGRPCTHFRRRQWQATPILLPRKSHGWSSLVGYSPWGRYESVATERLHFHTIEKEVATYSSVLAWRFPGTGEPGGLPSMGLHRVGHDWSNLAAAAAHILD